jgi:hypothetical protein
MINKEKDLFSKTMLSLHITCTGQPAVDLFWEYYEQGYFNNHTYEDFASILQGKIQEAIELSLSK